MAYITVGTENSVDIELFYEDQGSGQPVVLIHGFPLDGDSWEKQAAALLDAGYRVITYDRRGFGSSSQPSAPATTTTPSPPTSTRAPDDPRPARRRPRRLLDGHRRGRAATSRTYGSARVAKAAFLASLEPFLLKTDDNPDGAAPQPSSSTASPRQSARTATPTSPPSTRTSTTSTRTSARASARRRSRQRGDVAAGSGRSPRPPRPSPGRTDFRADIPKIDVPALILHGTADRILPDRRHRPPVLQGPAPRRPTTSRSRAPRTGC